MHRRRWVVVLALLVATVGCGSGGERAASPSGPTIAGSTQPVVLLAGDSVMEQLAGALVPALEGRVDARYVALPNVAGDQAAPTEWSELLAADPAPELVVVLVGTWEAIGAESLPGGIEQYAASLVPFVDVVTARTELLWLGHPGIQHEGAVSIDAMAAGWSALPATHPRTEYLDAGAAVEHDGRFATLLEVQGREVLVRQIDGRHLCPDGVVLMARVVLDELHERFGVEPVDGWEDAGWRDPDRFDRPELCPPGLGADLPG